MEVDNRSFIFLNFYDIITVARSLDESATLEGSASQASSEGSTLWGK